MTNDASSQPQPVPAPENTLNPGDQAPPGAVSSGENICRDCSGKGSRDGKPCPTCGGTGRVNQAIGGA